MFETLGGRQVRSDFSTLVVFQSKMVALSASVGQNVEIVSFLVCLVPQILDAILGRWVTGSDFRPSAPLLVRF